MLLPESWRKARKALSLRISLPPRPSAAAASALPLSPSLPPLDAALPPTPSSSAPPAFTAPPAAPAPTPSPRTAPFDRSTYGGGNDDGRRALEELALREAEEEQRLLEPVLRMLDDSIASFRSPTVAADKNGCVSAKARSPAAAPWNQLQQPADFDDDELLPDQVGDDNDSGPPSPALEITAVLEETAVPRCEERENLTVVIHVKAAAGSSGGGSCPNPTVADDSSALQQRRRRHRADVDLVAVLDVSGSMSGSKLALLKQAMRLVVRSLGDADRLSVVAFSDSARRVAALCRMTVGGRRAAMDAVNSLVCCGGTSIGDGLKEGLAVLRQRRQQNPVAAVMLLSDGRDSFTMRSPAPPDDSYAAFPVHTFGLGHDHDAATLHGIAQRSGGTFSFVRGEGLLPEAFAQCVGGVLSVVALQAVVAVQAIGAAELRGVDAGGYTSEAVESGVLEEVELGHVYADEERDMLANFLLRAAAPAAESGGSGDDVERQVIAVASVRYVDAVTGQRIRTAETEVAVRRPAIGGGGGGGGVDVRVERQRDRLAAARAMEEARRMAEVGDLGAARERLAEERRRLKGSAALRAGDRLSAVVEAELGRYEESMRSPRRYDGAAMAEGLAALASHLRQRAATRDGEGGEVYRTPAMNTMVINSRTWEGGVVGAIPSPGAGRHLHHRLAPLAAE